MNCETCDNELTIWEKKIFAHKNMCYKCQEIYFKIKYDNEREEREQKEKRAYLKRYNKINELYNKEKEQD